MTPDERERSHKETRGRSRNARPQNSMGAPVIVTLDGPAGVGKSTLAKRVAESLGVAYLDTGAMFRTVALHLHKQGLPGMREDRGPDAGESSLAEQLLRDCRFALEGCGAATRLLCNDAPVGGEIRSEEAGMMAARAGRIPAVRAFLKAAQQRLGQSFSLVAEGRDMGTVVFPAARCKIFLDADIAVRAQRRFRQLKEMGREAEFSELMEDMRKRDEQDRNRSIAPLRPAEDARCIDTSHMDAEEVFAAIMEQVESVYGYAGGGMPPFRPMRRKERALSRKQSLELLARGEYGMLAVSGADGWPYAVPLSYVLMEGCVYFHCARNGRKIESLAGCDKVCFTVVGQTQPVYIRDFSTYYESVMVFGRASLVEEEGEKRRSLTALAEKYLPEHMDKAEADIGRSFSRTAVYRILPDLVTGKAKKREACPRRA